MRIEEIKRRQHESDGKCMFLIKQGMFWNAFNEAASFISSYTGYQVRTRYTPDGETYELLGFPINTLPKVINAITENNRNIEIVVNNNIVKITRL